MNGSSRPLFDYEGCRALDRAAQDAGYSEQQLMGQAALASLTALAPRLPAIRRCVILCGAGNNGGDGYALAAHLLGAAATGALALPEDFSLILIRERPPKSAAAAFYAAQTETALRRSERPIHLRLGGPAEFFTLELDARDCVIEALLGTGQSAPVRGWMAQALLHLVQLRAQKSAPMLIALDAPAGLFEDAPGLFIGRGASPSENRAAAAAPAPDEVHCYGADKAALRLQVDLATHARIEVLPIGFPTAPSVAPVARLSEPPEDRDFFLKRASDHKYSAGHGLIVGGQRGMEGALIMACEAFFAAGGGILHAATFARESREWLAARLPGVMFFEQSDPPAALKPASITMGPGLGALDDSATLLEWLREMGAAEIAPTLVLDASAARLALAGAFPDTLRARTLLTPHVGEWRALGAPNISSVRDLDRAAEWNRRYARVWSYVKGSISALLAPDQTAPLIFSDPCPDLALAGSGDILAGALCALLARRRETPLSIAEAVRRARQLLHGAARLKVNPVAGELTGLIQIYLGRINSAEAAP
jgi:NAD(P)H-hydrate epimerase